MEEKMKKVPWYDRIESTIIIVLITIMTVILFANVVTRYFLSYTPSWTEQAARILFVYATFAGVSLAGKTGAHLRVSAINMVIGEKRGAVVFWIGDIITIVFAVYIAWKIFGVMMMVQQTGQVFSAIPWLPAWLLYLPGVLGMLGLAIRIIEGRVREVKERRKDK